jgi:DNA repair protein RecO (recombination protein O)
VSLFTDTGVVLRTYRLGEADRIVVLLTAGHGKVRAVAKGVRRTASRFGGRLEPLSHVTLQLWHGRGELDTVRQAEVVRHFPVLRQDLGRLSQGMAILEVADQLAQERHPDHQLYEMVVGALEVLDDQARQSSLVAPAFFLKALALEGAAPVVDGCAACEAPAGETVELVAFDMSEGGTLCRRCRRGRSISPQALDVLRQVLGGGLGRLLSGADPQGAAEAGAVATEAMEAHLDRRLRAVRSTAAL